MDTHTHTQLIKCSEGIKESTDSVEKLNKEWNKWEKNRKDDKVEVEQRVKILEQKVDSGGEMMQSGSVQS